MPGRASSAQGNTAGSARRKRSAGSGRSTTWNLQNMTLRCPQRWRMTRLLVGTYNRSRSGCYFCFFQQKLEWIWLYEQHPDLFTKAMEFEKDGYTWNQNESLADLIKPERVRQIKLDAIKKQEAKRQKGSGKLVDLFGDPEENNEAFCANCFI